MRRSDNLTTFMCRLSWNLGASPPGTLWASNRPVQVWLYLYHFSYTQCESLITHDISLRSFHNCIQIIIFLILLQLLSTCSSQRRHVLRQLYDNTQEVPDALMSRILVRNRALAVWWLSGYPPSFHPENPHIIQA